VLVQAALGTTDIRPAYGDPHHPLLNRLRTNCNRCST
jgi:hypothetical protein